MKRLVAVLVAAVSGLSLAGFGGANASAGPGRATVVATTAGTLSAWTACHGAMECSTLTVPLDHDNPAAGTIRLAVTRIKADPAVAYYGVMLTNPGGPGGSGTWMPSMRNWIPSGAGKHYDWIGFDPRGVGESSPALRCNSRYFGTDRPHYVPTTRRLMRFWRTKTNRYAARCGASAAKRLLPHMSTRDTVLDMESLRAALQAQKPAAGNKLNFYGFSYGSYLGQVYATTFPDQVGRFVLDGVVDPTRWWYGANLDQEVWFDRNLKTFFRWIAKHPGAYHLGRDWRAVRRGYYALLKRLDRRPAYSGQLGPNEVTDAILNAGYYVYNWDQIASAYSRLVRHGRGGMMFSLYAGANMGDDNGYAVYLGVQCSDVRRPAWRTQKRDAWRIHERHPFLAWDNTWFNAPCVRWQAPSHTRIPVSGAAVTAKILLINETRDAATPYSGALRVRSLFPSARLIAGVDGTTHSGSLSGVGCVDQRIAAYLNSPTGASVPARLSGSRADVNCPKVRPPTATGYRTTAGGGLPADLRAMLTAAQQTGR